MALLVLLSGPFVACGSEDAPGSVGPDALSGAGAAGESGAPGDGAALDAPGGLDAAPVFDRLAAARAAATAVAMADPYCDEIARQGQPPGFYWEIGDALGVLASGSRGAYGYDTVKTVASATKMVTAAYFLERQGGLAPATKPFLNFTSPYVASEQTCPDGMTVEQCHEKFGGDALFDASKAGRFYYGPDHMQKLAVQFADLRTLDAPALAAEYARVLRLETPFSFKYAALASGIEAGPKLFREFLQKLVGGGYRLRDVLGQDRVCTRDCGLDSSSPVDEPWHYSYGHWVEDGALRGMADGAFMGLGATGFYVWVDASKRIYGILGRWAFPLAGAPVPEPSAFCGQRIRAALLDTWRRSAAHCGDADRACSASEVCCDGTCAARCD